MAAAKNQEPAKKRLTREDWVDAATQRLVKRSIDAVRVEPLADDLKVSRGSFYWHFRSRAELLDAILATWQERQTRRIVERIRQDRHLSAEQQLAKLRALPARTKSTREAAALELAIRAWARRDNAARRVVEAVDAERIDFTQSLIAEAGAEPSESRYWALIGYAFTLGESLLREKMSEQENMECRSRLLKSQSTVFKQKTLPAKRAAAKAGT